MPSTIGPLFYLKASVPQEWNEKGLLGETQLAVRLESGEGRVLELASKSVATSVGSERGFFIAQVLREDAELLFAFENPLERALFLELREIDSIGPKTAAQVLFSLGVEGLQRLLNQGVQALPKIPGLGPKSLEKLYNGLKSNKKRFTELLLGVAAPSMNPGRPLPSSVAPQIIVSTLEKLGLRASDCEHLWREALAEIPHFKEYDHAEVIRILLQRWGRVKVLSQLHSTEQSA